MVSSANARTAAGHPRSPSFDSESSWTDTGDIGDRYDDVNDPVRLQLPDDLQDELLAGVAKRQPRSGRGTKKVRIYSPSPQSRYRAPSQHYHIDKEAIRVPNPQPRPASRGERCVGSIMAGRAGALHGLTGKALLYVLSDAPGWHLHLLTCIPSTIGILPAFLYL